MNVVPQSNVQVLEDNDEALLEAGGNAEIVGEEEEFVDLSAPAKKDESAAPAVAKPQAPAAKPQAPAAAAAPAAGDDELPPEFRGKTMKDVVKMYQEAHATIGRQGTELGEFRKLADVLLRAPAAAARRPAAPGAQPAAKPQPIDESQVFAKPIETISQLIEQHPAIQEIRRTMGERAAVDAHGRAMAAKASFDAAHPDAGQIMQDTEFRKWVSASPVRRSLLVRANNHYDFAAGDEIFSTWKALNKGQPAPSAAAAAPAAGAAPAADGAPSEDDVKAAAATLARAKAAKNQSAAAKAAAAPTGGGSAAPAKGGKKLYRRADLIRLNVEDPDRYEQMSAEIQQAYAEGRVR